MRDYIVWLKGDLITIEDVVITTHDGLPKLKWGKILNDKGRKVKLSIQDMLAIEGQIWEVQKDISKLQGNANI